MVRLIPKLTLQQGIQCIGIIDRKLQGPQTALPVRVFVDAHDHSPHGTIVGSLLERSMGENKPSLPPRACRADGWILAAGFLFA